MKGRRLDQLVYFGLAVAWAVLHIFWGKAILGFLATVLFWVIAGVIILVAIDAIARIVNDSEVEFLAEISENENISHYDGSKLATPSERGEGK